MHAEPLVSGATVTVAELWFYYISISLLLHRDSLGIAPPHDDLTQQLHSLRIYLFTGTVFGKDVLSPRRQEKI